MFGHRDNDNRGNNDTIQDQSSAACFISSLIAPVIIESSDSEHLNARRHRLRSIIYLALLSSDHIGVNYAGNCRLIKVY